MVGHLKVAYQNVCKGSDNAHTFLQWCWEKKVDIVFIGEPWRSGDIKSNSLKDGTQLHDAYLKHLVADTNNTHARTSDPS